MDGMIGDRIRAVRGARQLSLTDVASEADISVATLSRIERGKQTLDLSLFLTILRILEVNPAELLDDEARNAPQGSGVDPLVSRITSLAAAERTRLWRSLAERRQAARQTHASRNVEMQMEELLAQADYLREEIVSMQKRMKSSSRRG
jgi:transcriptional regulator with XRE-family HTH domain